jgi:GalNAc-alpha-(1->4)-GalNAc-alpha-(1->3)-diNAcBac-PP-undecaprenol alpha-1,4-N-acetyl-D-galactosaminyltransferase
MEHPNILFIPPECDPELSDAQILKDTCLVPCLLQKYYNFNATIAAYAINEKLLHNYFPDCNFISFRSSGEYIKDACDFITQNALQYDILYFYGAYVSYLSVAQAFKMNNPNGKIYLKMDMNRYWLSRVASADIFKQLLSICDLSTVECRALQKQLNQKLPYDIQLIPNGFFETFVPKPLDYSEKENVILTVGRLGTDQKQTNVMIEGFLKASIPGWKLRLVGSMEPDFLPVIEEYKSLPGFSNVEFAGIISDREQIDNEYRKAKIFCMTSNLEGMAHVYSEAGKNGCYIITTDVDGVYDLTENGKYGTVIPVGDINALETAFKTVCNDEDKIRKVFGEISCFARREYCWREIFARLHTLFQLKGLVKAD